MMARVCYQIYSGCIHSSGAVFGIRLSFFCVLLMLSVVGLACSCGLVVLGRGSIKEKKQKELEKGLDPTRPAFQAQPKKDLAYLYTTLLQSKKAHQFGPGKTHETIERYSKAAKIESDRKRKKGSISSAADRAPKDREKEREREREKEKEREREREKHKKRAKMASSNQVRASHILIKHEGSRRKASWKDPEGSVIRSTTRDAAVSQLKAIREDIVSGKAKFDDVASRLSDCSSAKRGGDLGPFGRGQMQKPFEDITFALKVGEISDIVDTDSGVHIILRTG
ncbi:hypothetical protein Tsubulata_006808 [Turnera subulata]|uniref:Peptidyl-prolyl cis-trans isomerase n=1 Tax=Turnera subulata TaxID=218843 RepID=A0A9Q0FBU8_9ROSI|nr:hypothetical protein Tsubulata_006808 [Turnera subulata]